MITIYVETRHGKLDIGRDKFENKEDFMNYLEETGRYYIIDQINECDEDADWNQDYIELYID